MRYLRLMIVTVLALAAFAAPSYAVDKLEDLSNSLVNDSWQLVTGYWNIVDLRCQFNELKGVPEDQLIKIYKAEVSAFEKTSRVLANRVIKGLRKSDKRSLELLSEFYVARKDYEKPAFEVAVREIVDFIKAELAAGRLSGIDPKRIEDNGRGNEYFPGYGYGDPSFIYRKGLQVEESVISTYWQEETKTWESNKHFEGTIEFKLAAELRPKVDHYQELSEPFKLDVGGHILLVIKVSFDVRESLVTKATKQYAVHKIWFELFRADRNYWSSPKWELCGKTYELRDEPTGMVATIGVKFAK